MTSPSDPSEGLDPLFALQWMAALLSGDFKQGRGQLHIPDGDRYCCLGVACAIGGKLTPYMSQSGYGDLPTGFRVSLGMGLDVEGKLIRMNDDEHKRFPSIAKYISTLPIREG